MKQKLDLIKKSIGASMLIALGNFALLKIGNPIGPILFSLGLLAVCYLNLNLFTGKCGYIFEDKINILDLSLVLVTNLFFGYLFGMVFRYIDSSVIMETEIKISTWEFSFPFFLKALACGIIMYLAVELFRKGTILGILLGIPMFIFCGFQHCIANVITMGIAIAFDWSIVLAIVGNFVGSILAWWIVKEKKQSVEK